MYTWVYLRIASSDVLNFHRDHGENLALSEGDRVVTRKRGNDRAVCAIKRPLTDWHSHSQDPATADVVDEPFAYVSMLITDTDDRLSGGLGLGVSSQPPAPTNLPDSAFNAEKGWVFMQIPQNDLEKDIIVIVWINPISRELCYVCMSEEECRVWEKGGEWEGCRMGEVLLDDPAILNCLDNKHPVWLYLDIYGFVKQIHLLSNNSSYYKGISSLIYLI